MDFLMIFYEVLKKKSVLYKIVKKHIKYKRISEFCDTTSTKLKYIVHNKKKKI